MRRSVRAWLDLLCGPVPLMPGMWLFGDAHRQTILQALKEAADKRSEHGRCADCKPGEPCLDRVIDASIAEGYGELRALLQRGRRTR